MFPFLGGLELEPYNFDGCSPLAPQAGASPNAVDAEDAKSPLVLSASVGHREICQVLLEAKALVMLDSSWLQFMGTPWLIGSSQNLHG